MKENILAKNEECFNTSSAQMPPSFSPLLFAFQHSLQEIILLFFQPENLQITAPQSVTVHYTLSVYRTLCLYHPLIVASVDLRTDDL